MKEKQNKIPNDKTCNLEYVDGYLRCTINHHIGTPCLMDEKIDDTPEVKEEWIEEFNEKWGSCNCENGWDLGQCSVGSMFKDDREAEDCEKMLKSYIKDFISQLLSKQAEEISGAVEELRKPDEPKKNIVRRSHIEVYNKALSDILLAIKQVINK